jgi:hypothetical protein
MSKLLYCWRCQMEIPMLEDHEAEYVLAPMQEDWADFDRIRKESLERYREVTGFNESNINAVWHHRISLYGRPCSSCGKPLRTPRSKLCAACGTMYH